MGVYDRQKAAATRMIEKYGSPVVWSSMPTSSAVDPEKPWEVVDTAPTEYTPIIAIFPAGSKLEKVMRLMAGSDVPTGNEVGYMASVPFIPSLKDTFLRKNGETYRIRDIDVIAPNDEGAILYVMDLQK